MNNQTITQWKKLSPLNITRELQNLVQQLRQCEKNSEVGALLHAYIEDGSSELTRRINVVKEKDWSVNAAQAEKQLSGVIFLRAELDCISSLLPHELLASLDQTIKSLSAAIGKSSEIETSPSRVELTDNMLPLTISNLPDSIDSTGLYSLYFRVAKEQNLSPSEIRHIERLMKQYSHYIDKSHPYSPLVENIQNRMTLIRKRQLNLNVSLKPQISSLDQTRSEFDTTKCGFAFNLKAIQAHIRAPRIEEEVYPSKTILRTRPWFVKHYSSVQFSNHTKHTFSRGIELFEFDGQYTFGNSPSKDAVKITKRLLKHSKVNTIVIWGDDHYVRDIVNYCTKLDIATRVLCQSDLQVVKERVERQVNRKEIQNGRQKVSIQHSRRKSTASLSEYLCHSNKHPVSYSLSMATSK